MVQWLGLEAVTAVSSAVQSLVREQHPAGHAKEQKKKKKKGKKKRKCLLKKITKKSP